MSSAAHHRTPDPTISTPAHANVVMTPGVPESTRSLGVPLHCPKCRSALSDGGDVLECPGCGATYPVRDGIPRFFEDESVWSEVQLADARRLSEQARRIGWREAVNEDLALDEAGRASILDWQRASWIPLLQLPTCAVVLDAAGEYGAITHALAEHFDEVHALDPIPERLEFIKARLDQSGHSNVRLAAGRPIDLPFAPGSFDAIIVNGALEWIGHWDIDGTPREAQLRYLQQLHALLKPGGRLLIGSENRFGYPSFAGAVDHSGLRYTSLLPRRLASMALRASGAHHHTLRVPPGSYRTWTYTERGYNRLFEDAGFDRNDGFWAEPGHREPYRLTPLDRRSIHLSLRELQSTSKSRGHSLRERLKRAIARVRMLRAVLPDFVFIVHKGGTGSHTLEDMLPVPLRKTARYLLTTYRFGEKTTIRAYTPDSLGVILKASTAASPSHRRVAQEYAELQNISHIASQETELPFEVAAPLGLDVVGRQLITVESRAPGAQVSVLFARMNHGEQVAFLRTHLPVLARSAASMTYLGRGPTRHVSADGWLQTAQTVLGASHIARAKAIGDKYAPYLGHGDFTVENCVLDRGSNKVTVIDWEFVRIGLPPLYDLFTLYLTIQNLIHVPPVIARRIGDPTLARYYTAFFDHNEISSVLALNISREYESHGIDPATSLTLFEDALMYRIGYLIERKSSIALSRLRFLTAMQKWKKDFRL
jgi:SAM-dependent methyltransferase